MPLNLPNLLTLSRILLIPAVLLLIHQRSFTAGFLLAGWVFLTDYLDGRLARKLGIVTQAGMILDPVADKLVALAMFGYFFAVERGPGWYVVLIFVRDLAQLASIPVLLWWKKSPSRSLPNGFRSGAQRSTSPSSVTVLCGSGWKIWAMRICPTIP